MTTHLPENFPHFLPFDAREAYEEACGAYATTPLADNELRSVLVRSAPNAAESDASETVRLSLAHLRYCGLLRSFAREGLERAERLQPTGRIWHRLGDVGERMLPGGRALKSDCCEYRGVPIILDWEEEEPTYRVQLDPPGPLDGDSTAELPHVRLHCGQYKTYWRIEARAYGSMPAGYRRSWPIEGLSRFCADESELRAYVRHPEILDLTVPIFDRFEDWHDAFDQEIHALRNAAPFATRDAYESACRARHLPSLSDAELLSTGSLCRRELRFPFDAREELVGQQLGRKRLQGLLPLPEPGETPRVPKINWRGELWEICPVCGEEPIGNPLTVCAACWPRMELHVYTTGYDPEQERLQRAFGMIWEGLREPS